MKRLDEIKERYENRLEPSDDDVKWLIEHAENAEKERLKTYHEGYKQGRFDEYAEFMYQSHEE